MCRLKLVKTAKEEAAAQQQNNESASIDDGEQLPHGAKVLVNLVSPWIRSQRIVCADSYFALVAATMELGKLGLRFIGVVKTATRRFPWNWLRAFELVHRGDCKGLVSLDADGRPNLLAFIWMDRERRCFITNTASLEEGRAYERWQWRQISDEPNAPPQLVDLVVPQPRAAEIYYSVCGKIDQHNRSRQDTLKLETKLEMKCWWK